MNTNAGQYEQPIELINRVRAEGKIMTALRIGHFVAKQTAITGLLVLGGLKGYAFYQSSVKSVEAYALEEALKSAPKDEAVMNEQQLRKRTAQLHAQISDLEARMVSILVAAHFDDAR